MKIGNSNTNYTLNPLENNNDATNSKNYGWWDQLTGSATTSAVQTSFNADQAQKERDFNAGQQEKAQNFSAEEAQKQRDYETEMSNTAYQRAKADAEAAGMNILNMTNQQASTPSGSAASGQAVSGSGGAKATYANNGAGNFLAGLIKTAVGVATGHATLATKGIMQTAQIESDKALKHAMTAYYRARADAVK